MINSIDFTFCDDFFCIQILWSIFVKKCKENFEGRQGGSATSSILKEQDAKEATSASKKAKKKSTSKGRAQMKTIVRTSIHLNDLKYDFFFSVLETFCVHL